MQNSKEELENKIQNVIKTIKETGREKVRFIMLYGSAARGELTTFSDIDLAVFYDGDEYERFDFRVKILGRVWDRFDIQTFQDLPVYIQQDIISTGKIIYFRNYKEIFDIFMKTIKNFENFKPHLELYYSAMGV